MTTITIDTLAYFYNQGGRFCRPIGRSKEDMETGWTQKPYDLQAIVAHVNAGNNAGLLTGEKSANIGLFDLDRKYQAFCKKFPRFAAFPTVYRLDADDRAKFAFIVEDSVENISQLKSVKYKPFGETHPWFEFLWTGRYAIIPPSKHPDSGADYHLKNAGKLPKITAKEADSIWFWLTGERLIKQTRPKKANNTYSSDDIKEEIRGKFDLEIYAIERIGGEAQEERNGEIRIKGNGGLLVKDKEWYCHSDSIGGDCFDLAGYKLFGNRWDRTNAQMFIEALHEAADFAGIDLTQRRNGHSMNGTQTTPQAAQPASQQQAKPGHDILRDRWLSSQPPTAYGLGDFRRYHAGIWQTVNELEVKASISEVVEAAKVEGIKVTSAVVSSVTDLTKFKTARPDSIWDSNSDFLVCRNGTLCIPDRVLGEHNPAIYATSGVSFDYDPTAKAPAWEAFLFDLAQSTSPAVVTFLQEFAGYALTTDTRFELSIWLFGPPGSGKSTFLTGLEAMLGSRAGLLGLADIINNRFALANLPGKTLAISTEQPGDYIASTHILNALISGESITVDIKFKPAIRITPRCKLAWAMNEIPRVSDPNSGLFRRVKVVEFPVIPESERDPALKESIKTEGAGILNWALDGLQRLRNRGRFEIPQEVKDATENFKANNDIPARFVEECCLTGEDANGEPYRAQATQLYNAYKLWCAESGHRPQSSTGIAIDWKRLGFEKRRPGGVVYWYFVGLRAG